jgi:hypothetical protein
VVEPTELLGTWRLARRIVDRDGPHRTFGRVHGTLELSRGDDGAVRWHERGELAWNGQHLTVFRTLHVVPMDGGWTVCFDDGREFHPWRPGTPVVHPCRADTYRGLVAVDAGGDLLRVLWDVTGPAKDRRLFTRCTRTRP